MCSCIAPAQKRVITSNTGIKVELLYKIDDCSVYRFYDGGYPRYFSDCPGSIDWKEECGKNCTRKVRIETVYN